MTAIVLRFVLPMTILTVMAGAVFFYITSAERAKRELDDARDRLETIDTVKGLEDEAANDTDDDLADSISDVQQPR